MQNCISVWRKSVSRQRSDKCYLNIVHIGQGDRNPGPEPNERNFAMFIQMNRALDVLVSFAIVALSVGLAVSTAIVA